MWGVGSVCVWGESDVLEGFGAPFAALPGAAVFAGEDADAARGDLDVVLGAEGFVVAGDAGGEADGAVGGDAEDGFAVLHFGSEFMPVPADLLDVHLPAFGDDGLAVPEVDGGLAALHDFFDGEVAGALAFGLAAEFAQAQFDGVFGLVFVGAVVDFDEAGVCLHGAGAAHGLGGKGGGAHGALEGGGEDAVGPEAELGEVEADAAPAFFLDEFEVGVGADAGGGFSLAEGVAVAGDDERFHGFGVVRGVGGGLCLRFRRGLLRCAGCR